jgi:uncharacterized surface protein with fasciclin (FAS1) repeats
MKVTDTFYGVNARAGSFGSMLTLLLLATVAVFLSSAANAGDRYHKSSEVSDALEAEGFQTLRLALDLTGLLPVLDSNRVTLFAPTNDVFDATAEALGCTDALDLATRLINIPTGDGSNALADVLSYHAVLRVIRTNKKLLKSSPLHAASGGTLTTGVNSEGLFVKGEANATPSRITVDGIRGHRWVIYPIDSILLPIDPTGICGPVSGS